MEVDSITPEEALSKENLSKENLRKFHASTGQVDRATTMEVDKAVSPPMQEEIKVLEENVKKFSSCPWRMTLHNQTAC